MKKILLSFCICLFSLLIQAQENPISWSFGAEHVSGSNYLIKFTAEIDKNWVLYSQHIGEGGPVPTGFFFTENKDIKLVGEVEEKSKAIKEIDEVFEMEVVKFKDKAEFEQLVELKTDGATLSGELEYMTCDGAKCLPPKTIEFSIKIE